MKLCHQCQAENPDDVNVCQSCGTQLTPEEEAQLPTEEQTQTKQVAEETPAEPAAEQETPAEDTPAPEIPEIPEKPQKKSSLTALIVILLIAAIAVAAIIGISRSGKKEEVTEEPTVETPAEEPADVDETQTAMVGHHTNAYGLPSHSIYYEQQEDGTYVYSYLDENAQTVTLTQEMLDALMEQNVATCGDMSISNRQIMFYYDDQWYSFSSTYSAYLSYMMNTAQGLDEQLGMDGESTWEQLFVDSGISMFHQIAAVTAQAKAEGFTLSDEEQAELDAVEDNLNETAVLYGFADAEVYLQAYFGPSATLENYLEYYARSYYVNSFLSQVQSNMTATDEELEAYYEENAELMQTTYGIEKIDKPVVHVRHILVTPESTTNDDGTTTITDEAWAAAEAKAQEIYADWQSDPTEDYFAGLAAMHTDDPGSQSTGGLYEDVYPGQMVTEFNDWCFADGRTVGDTGIVKTTYGYHLMYFVGEGDYIYWQQAANNLLISQKVTDYIKELQDAAVLTSDASAVVLLSSTAPSAPTEGTAETETAETEAADQ